jgi:nitrogen-specific signal transduction histidine kinase
MKKSSVLDLAINATLGELELSRESIDLDKLVVEALTFFREKPNVPGLLVHSADTYVTMISRACLFTWMSLPYSQELYTKRTIRFFLENNPVATPVVFGADMQVSEATFRYLDMNTGADYEPVVVRFFDDSFAVLDTHHLLFAHACIHLKYVESLKQANELKSEILSIVAHDLKNPLNALLGLSALLSDEIQEAEEVQKMRALMRQSSEHMLELITELLDSSVSEIGMKKMHMTEVNVIPLLTGIITLNSKLAARKKQTITFTAEAHENCMIIADKVRMHEAIDNIVNNAVKYSAIAAAILVHVHESESEVFVSVYDEGPGFTENDMQHLFSKFQRLSAKPTNGESSTGLGLYIVKQIINLHGGRIEIQKRPQAGSIMTLIFPKITEKSLPRATEGRLHRDHSNLNQDHHHLQRITSHSCA